jgi:4-hydroxy-tetrahydrodipicolinate synthase
MLPGRLLTAMVTPFTPEGAVDWKQARRLAGALIDSGSDGLVVSGTTGESPTLTFDEKVRLFEELKGEIAARGTIVAGTGSYSTAESIHLTQAAERAGADAILLVVPYYNKPSQEGLYQHFNAIARETSLPCIVYNVPSRTSLNMTAETVIRLAETPNIVGVKEANGDLAHTSRVIENAGPEFRVWSGNDNDTLPILAIGGYGVISVVSHLAGRQLRAMIDSFLAGKTHEAAAIHRRLVPLVDSLFVIGSPSPLKFVLEQVGFSAGKPRLPLVPPDEATGAKIMAEVGHHQLDLPIPVP